MTANFDNELDIIKNKNIWPKLKEQNIKVFADYKPLEILSMTEVPEFLAKIEGEKYYRPSYVLTIPKGNQDKIIKIQIQDVYFINDKKIIEKGEGYYLWN